MESSQTIVRNVDRSLADLADTSITESYRIGRIEYLRGVFGKLCERAAAIEEAEQAIADEVAVRFESVRDLVPYGSCGAVHDQSGYVVVGETVSIASDGLTLPPSGRVRVIADDGHSVACDYRRISTAHGEASYEISIA